MKTCPDCLSEIPEAATFCRFCGERVRREGMSRMWGAKLAGLLDAIGALLVAAVSKEAM